MATKLVYKKEFVVKITISLPDSHIVEDVVYYRRHLTLDQVIKWQSYWQYIAALVKVKNPRRYVRCYVLCTEMETRESYIEWKRENLLKARKAKLDKLEKIPVEWDLFGFNQTERVEKEDKIKEEIRKLENGEITFYVPNEYVNNVKKWV